MKRARHCILHGPASNCLARGCTAPSVVDGAHIAPTSITGARTVTLELTEPDCKLLVSALRLARATRDAGRVLLGRSSDTPLADERELELLRLLDQAIGN